MYRLRYASSPRNVNTWVPSVPSGLAKRARRIVLLAAEGMPNAQMARTVGVSRPTVTSWWDHAKRALDWPDQR
jgi:DNA-binding NarL/FixJ family response regulator